jgi:ribosomal protein S18 acetylase RimI-like enzyme
VDANAQAAAGLAGSEVLIRDLLIEDLAQVTRIDAGHTGVAKPSFLEGVFDNFVTAAQGQARVGLGAEIDGRLVGYLLGEVRAFEFGSEPCGWVFAVGIDEGHRRRGLASKLLGAASERFRELKVETVRTMVRRNDIPVLSFFRRNGFVGGPYVQLERPTGERRS